MQRQKDAVINTILSVLSERGVTYTMGGEVTMKDTLTADDKTKCRAILLEGFLNNTIEMSDGARAKHNTESLMKTYVNGLLNNWIKKHPPFNCGQKYVPANPGSRAGQGDETIKALRAILKQPGLDQESIDEVNEAIAQRLAEIKPSAVVEINVDALPEHLKHLAK